MFEIKVQKTISGVKWEVFHWGTILLSNTNFYTADETEDILLAFADATAWLEQHLLKGEQDE